MLGRHDAGELVQVIAQQHLEPEQDSRAGGGSGRRPLREGRPGRVDGRADFAVRREGHPRLDRAGGRIEYVAEPVAARGNPPSADEMVDGGGHGSLPQFASKRERYRILHVEWARACLDMLGNAPLVHLHGTRRHGTGPSSLATVARRGFAARAGIGGPEMPFAAPWTRGGGVWTLRRAIDLREPGTLAVGHGASARHRNS